MKTADMIKNKVIVLVKVGMGSQALSICCLNCSKKLIQDLSSIILSQLLSFQLFCPYFFIINSNQLQQKIKQMIFLCFEYKYKFKSIITYSMSRPFNFEQNENAQKQAVISSLKKQLYQLKDRQHEYIPLENQVTNIQSKYEMLQDQKERIENEHKIKLEMNRNNMVEIRLQIDSLKMQIHKSSVAIEEILRDISGIKRACQNRQNEISALMTSNHELASKNEFISEQNRNKCNKIKALKDQRNKLDIESERYVKQLQDNITLLKNLQKQARALQNSNSKLHNILSIAESDHSDLLQQMRNRSEVVNQTQRKLQMLNQEIESLREKTKKLQKERQKNQDDYKNITNSLELILNKNSEQIKRIKLSQNELRNLQNELDKSILQHDSLQKDYDIIISQNKQLHDQIRKIVSQIGQYQRKNVELKNQLENYIRYDEQAIKLLNRKESMLYLLQNVQKSLVNTERSIIHLK